MKNTFGNSISVTLFGESHGPYIGAVLDGVPSGVAVDEGFIAAQMEKRKGISTISTPRREDDEVKIVRTKRFAVKPMDVEEACIQMELLGHSFFVFRNAETDEVNVVYKRKGNTYGLIEPEY